MVVFPRSAPEVLGFDAIRQRILESLSCPDSAELCRAEQPARSSGDAVTRLERTAEYQRLLSGDDPLRLGDAFDPDGLLNRARPKGSMLEAEEIRRIGDLARESSIVREYLAGRTDVYPRLAEFAGALMPLDAVVEATEAAIDERGMVRDNASPTLRRIRRDIAKTESSLRASLDDALASARSQGYDGGDQPTVRNGRMVIPIRVEAKRKVGGFVHDVSASGQTVYVEPAASLELNNDLSELRASDRMEVRRILVALTDTIRDASEGLRANAHVLLAIDVIRSKAILANHLGSNVPDVSAEPQISLRSARHPILLLRALASGDRDAALRAVVPLDFELGGDARTVVVSGPNAGGKTVVLKTIGLFTLMMAHGIPVPSSQGSVLFLPDRLMLDIGDEQSVDDDLSTFGARIVHLREILQTAGSGTLVLIDEAGGGTDPAEGAALAQSVLEWLTVSGALTVATTHQQRLKVFAMEQRGVNNGSMLIEAETLSPSYRYQPGVAGSSYGLAIARREGLDDAVVGRAEALAGDESVRLDRLLAELSERLRELDSNRAALDEHAAALERERERLERLEAELAAERRTAKQRAASEATAMIEAANARIEKTIREIKESGAEKKATRAARSELETFRQHVAGEAGPSDAMPQPAGVPGPIEAGDRVVLDGGSASAEVLSIDGDRIEISAGTTRLHVDRSRLRKISGPEAQRVSFARASPGFNEEAGFRIDVRGERVDPAIGRVMRFVDSAVAAGLLEVEVLHGTGTGALRRAIREYLETRTEVSTFDDAPLEQGGPGVTVVWLE